MEYFTILGLFFKTINELIKTLKYCDGQNLLTELVPANNALVDV